MSALSVNENETSDSKSFAEAFNDYFIDIGPRFAAECDDEQCNNTEPLVIDDANQSSRTQFKFSPILVDGVISTLRKFLNYLRISLHPHSHSSLIRH